MVMLKLAILEQKIFDLRVQMSVVTAKFSFLAENRYNTCPEPNFRLQYWLVVCYSMSTFREFCEGRSHARGMLVWDLLCQARFFMRPHRLVWSRTPPFHGGNRGSNPLGDAIFNRNPRIVYMRFGDFFRFSVNFRASRRSQWIRGLRFRHR
jgi:hypothetical protein